MRSKDTLPSRLCAFCKQPFYRPHHPRQPFCSLTCRSLAQRRPAPERFWMKVQITPTCWLYMGARTTAGYGSFRIKSHVTIYAHRYTYELAFGPIPAGYEVCHHCDQPACVRPAHFFLGTHGDNVRDMVAKGRQGRPGPKPFTVCKRGHPLSGHNAIQERSGGQRCRLCRNARQLARYHAQQARHRTDQPSPNQ